jgi:hypothetical protein
LPGFSSNDALSYKVRMYVRQWAPWLAALRSYTTSPPLRQVSRARVVDDMLTCTTSNSPL